MLDVQADLLQLFGYPWPIIAAQAETGLLVTISDRCLRLRKARVLMPTTSHSRSAGKLHLCYSTNPNLIAFADGFFAFQRFQRDRGLEHLSDVASVPTFLISFVLKISRLQIAAYVSVRIWGGSSAIRTTSARNSSVRFSPIVSLICCSKCYQRSGIEP